MESTRYFEHQQNLHRTWDAFFRQSLHETTHQARKFSHEIYQRYPSTQGRETQSTHFQLLDQKEHEAVMEREDILQTGKENRISLWEEVNTHVENLKIQVTQKVYECCGISEKLSENSWQKNFLKWYFDACIIENIEFVQEILKSWSVILDIVKTLCSWAGICQIAKALGDSIRSLWNGDAYEKGKVIGGILWLGIAGIGAKLGLRAWRQARKVWPTIPASPHAKIGDVVPEVNIANIQHAETRNIARTPEVRERIHQPIVRVDTPEWLEKLRFSPELSQALVDSKAISPLNDNIHTLTERFASFNKKEIPYEKLIQEVVAKTGMSEDAARLIMTSTDGMKIVENLNDFIRNPHKIKTPTQSKAILYLIDVMHSWLDTLPTARGTFFARADKHARKEGVQHLTGFTYATTDATRTFLREDAKNFVAIHGNTGYAKDISSLSLGTHFWKIDMLADTPKDRIGIMWFPTEVIILPGTSVYVTKLTDQKYFPSPMTGKDILANQVRIDIQP